MPTDRKPIIQKYADEIEPGWTVVKPQSPGDINDQCVLQKPAEYKVATVNLPVRWFDDQNWIRIKSDIERALKAAVVEH